MAHASRVLKSTYRDSVCRGERRADGAAVDRHGALRAAAGEPRPDLRAGRVRGGRGDEGAAPGPRCHALQRQRAAGRPDCGSAIVGGMPLGFANQVRAGDIGCISASGTGLQQLACLVHQWGGGISHAIGTGSRDLSQQVGGITMLRALKLLAEDEPTG